MTEPSDAAALVDAALRQAEAGTIDEALRLAGEGVRRCLDVAERLGGAGEVEPSLLASLGIALRLEYAYGGELASLEDAVEALRAGASAVDDRPGRAALLSELGGALLMWFRLHADPATLDEAVEALRRAVAELPADSPQRAQVLSNLAAALTAQHERSGTEADLEEAVAVLRQAIDATPAESPNDEALANLGALLLIWAGYRSDLASAREAVVVLRQAAERMPVDQPQRPRVLANLAAAHRLSYERYHDQEDLDEAVTFARAALAGTPAGAPEYAAVAGGLETVLRTRYEASGDPASLAESRAVRDRVAPPARPVDVLLAADDDLAEALAAALARHGFTVRRAESGDDVGASLGSARSVVLAHTYLTPDEKIALWRRRAEHPGVAVIVLGPAAVTDRVEALESGADDYLVMPFAVEELVARLRPVHGRASGPEPAAAPHHVRVGDVELDLDRQEVKVAGDLVSLSRKEFAILAVLARARGRACARRQILDEVWGDAFLAGSNRSLDVHIATLRVKLRRPHLIQTVRGLGYRLDTGAHAEPR